MPEKGWLHELRELCNENDILLILDEIQSGIGRTGKSFGVFNYEDIIPDAPDSWQSFRRCHDANISFSKFKNVMDHFNSGSHGSTFGGNPLASKIATRALELLYEDNLIDNSSELEKLFLNRKLRSIDNNNIIAKSRGKGLWILEWSLISTISMQKIYVYCC